MRWIACWLAAGALMVLSPSTAAVAAAPSDPVQVVRELIADINSGRVQAAVTLFAPDATWTDGPAELLPSGEAATAAGRTEIKARLALLTAGGSQLTPLAAPAASGDQVRLELGLSGGSLGLLGLHDIDLETVAVVRDGLISSVANTAAPASVPGLRGAMADAGAALPKTGSSPLKALLGWLLVALGAGLARPWRAPSKGR